MVMALAGFATAGTLPATAAPGTIEYVALGDSYAAGTASHGDCPNPDGYPELLDRSESRIGLTANAACSGATTDTVVLSPELNSAKLVTLTVGAANLGQLWLEVTASQRSEPFAGRRSLALIHRCLPSLVRTRPNQSRRGQCSFTHQCSSAREPR